MHTVCGPTDRWLERGRRPRQLLDHEEVRDVGLAPTSVRLGKRDPGEAQLGQLPIDRDRIFLAGFEVDGRGGGDLGGELTHHHPERALLVGEETQIGRHLRENTTVRIEDRRGEVMDEATVTVDDAELLDLLEGIADVVEGKRAHLHFNQVGGPQLVVRRTEEADADPLQRSLDWWVGPLILLAVVLLIVGGVTAIRWIVGLL